MVRRVCFVLARVESVRHWRFLVHLQGLIAFICCNGFRFVLFQILVVLNLYYFLGEAHSLLALSNRAQGFTLFSFHSRQLDLVWIVTLA